MFSRGVFNVNSKPEKQLKIGVLGCGAIAQAGHFESVTKARNATLHAICDVAEDLLQRFSVTYGDDGWCYGRFILLLPRYIKYK